MADGLGNLALLVTTEHSYLMVSLIDKLAERRIRTVSVDADIASIFQSKEKANVILVYVDQTPIGDEVLVFLRDRADTGNIPIILLGDKYNIEAVQKSISKDFIDSIFFRPINVDEVAAHVQAIIKARNASVKKKILVVDDSADTLKKIKEWLQGKYQVIVAKSGTMAIKYLTMEIPDLILLDYEMPVLNGKQVLEMIRSEKDFETIPIMFLTSCNDRNVVMDIAKLKPEGYLLKTMDPEQIIAQVDTFFAEKKAEKL
ncbi:MAG: response regulator [Butyrivibrio sp.]|jgi:response regulator RpfG family c-di-GMP phosphodiesterase|nr:response regulator [Butyrivibrio sp.]